MKKGMFVGVGVMFFLVVLVGGCGSTEDADVEAPAAQTEAVPVQGAAEQVQDDAAAVEEKVVDTAEQAVEEAASVTENTVGAVTEIGQEAMDKAGEKLAEEVQTAAETIESKGSELMEDPDVAAGVEQAEKAAAKADKLAGEVEAALKDKVSPE